MVRAIELFGKSTKGSNPHLLRLDQLGVQASNREVRLGHTDLNVANEIAEKRELPVHPAQHFEPVVPLELLERGPRGKPRGHHVPTLHPSEDPGNSSKVT